MKKLRRDQLDMLWVLVLALFSASIRFPRLGVGGFWQDEAITAWRVVDLHTTLTLNDGSPSFYPFVVWLSKSLFGESEWSLRLPSAVAGTLLPPVMYLLLRRRLSFLPSFLASALMAVSPIGVHYSQEARTYSLYALASFLFVVHCWFLTYPIGAPSGVNRKDWVLAFVFGAAMLQCHNYGVLVTAAVAAVAVGHLYRNTSHPLRGPSLRALLGLIGGLAIFWFVTYGFYTLESSKWVREAGLNNPYWPSFNIPLILHSCLEGPILRGFSVPEAILAAVMLFWVAFRLPPQHPGRFWGQLWLLLILLTVLNDWRLPHFMTRRYEFGFFPLIMVAAAFAVDSVPNRKLRPVLAGLMILSLAHASITKALYATHLQSGSKEMATYIAENQVDVAFVALQNKFDAFYPSPLAYYLHRRLNTNIPLIEMPEFRVVPDGFLSPTHYFIAYPKLVAITAEQEAERLTQCLQGVSSFALIGRRQDNLEAYLAVAQGLGFELKSVRNYPSEKDRGVGYVLVVQRTVPSPSSR